MSEEIGMEVTEMKVVKVFSRCKNEACPIKDICWRFKAPVPLFEGEVIQYTDIRPRIPDRVRDYNCWQWEPIPNNRTVNTRESILSAIYKMRNCINTKFGNLIHIVVYTEDHITVERKVGNVIINTCYCLTYKDWNTEDLYDVCDLLNIKIIGQ